MSDSVMFIAFCAMMFGLTYTCTLGGIEDAKTIRYKACLEKTTDVEKCKTEAPK
jgi:hypothetical protein